MQTALTARERPTTYQYRALTNTGERTRGTLRAADQSDAADLLRTRGLYPIALSPVAVRAQRALSTQDMATGLRVLASLLEAGLPMARSLAAFESLAPPSWRARATALRERVRMGGSLAGALSNECGIPPVLAGIVGAGEASGALPAAVRQAAQLAEDTAELRNTIRGALVYPVILLAAGAASVALLVTVVLPRFATILADLGQEPPAMTRFVLQTTATLQAAWSSTLLVALLSIVLGRAWTSTTRGRHLWGAFLLRVPVAGDIRHTAASSRVCLALAALVDAGVPIGQALNHAAEAAGNSEIAARIGRARAAVTEGARVGTALKGERALTDAATRLIMAGEESGQLAMLAAHAGRMEAIRARDAVRAAVRLLEPSLILIFGGMVAVVAGALLQAVYTVRPVGA